MSGKIDGNVKPEIKVHHCPMDFPIAARGNIARSTVDRAVGRVVGNSARDAPPQTRLEQKANANRIAFRDAANEVRALGATGFVGVQKRKHNDEEYYKFTGTHVKKQKVPLPIVRGIKKKAKQREERRLMEAREAGVVLPRQPRADDKKKRDRVARVHGPAPSVGFMSKGLLRVKDQSKQSR